MPVQRQKGETKEDFLTRCISVEREAGFSQDGAVAMCLTYYEQDNLQKFKKIRTNVVSSNVRRLMYNDETRALTIQFDDSSIYTYFDVSADTFEDIRSGNARPITTDSQNPPRWVKGEKPSVGAAVHQFLIDSGVTFLKGGSFR